MGFSVRHPLPSDFAQHAASASYSDLRRRYGVCYDVIARWSREVGIVLAKGYTSNPAPVPPDLTQIAPTMHLNALARHYGRNEKTVKRWLLENNIAAAPFNPSITTKKQWEEKPIRPRAAPVIRKPVKGRMVLPAGPRQAPRDTSRAGDAADFLKRWYIPVYRCDERGNLHHRPTSEHYRVGRHIVTTEEMFARAQRKGWNPEAWSQIAA